MYTNLLVDNGQLCQIYPYKKHSCDEMETVRLEAKRIHQLERYIDAQNGGPGRGWFRIITDPIQARSVANAGRLAVDPRHRGVPAARLPRVPRHVELHRG